MPQQHNSKHYLNKQSAAHFLCILHVVLIFLITLTPIKLKAQSAVQLFKRIEPSIVFIETNTGGGTGFCVHQSGLIATSLHVIDDSSRVSLSLGSRPSAGTVELVAVDLAADLAILRLAGSSCKPVLLGDSEQVLSGQRIFVIGNPLARRELSASISDGLVSGLRRLEGKQKVIQISAPLSPGNSGGPVVLENGEVIGVVAFKLTSGELLNFAIPANDLRALLLNAANKAIHTWVAGRESEYQSGAYRIDAAAAQVFDRARKAMGTCDLEDAAWEATIVANGVTRETKYYAKRDFGQLFAYTTTDQRGQNVIITTGKSRNGKWTKANGKLVASEDIVKDDVVNKLVDDWYCFCPGIVSMWRGVELRTGSTDGIDTNQIQVKDPFFGSSIIFTFSKTTGFLIQRRYLNKTTGGPIVLTDTFSDFRKVGRFTIAFTSIQTNDRDDSQAITMYRSFSPNNGYPDYFFEK